jgi:hypothetical protein
VTGDGVGPARERRSRATKALPRRTRANGYSWIFDASPFLRPPWINRYFGVIHEQSISFILCRRTLTFSAALSLSVAVPAKASFQRIPASGFCNNGALSLA